MVEIIIIRNLLIGGFIGYSLPYLLARPLNIHIKTKLFIPIGTILLNFVSAFALGICTVLFPYPDPSFFLWNMGLFATSSSCYSLFSSYILRKDESFRMKIRQILLMGTDLGIGYLLFMIGRGIIS